MRDLKFMVLKKIPGEYLGMDPRPSTTNPRLKRKHKNDKWKNAERRQKK